jgi:glucokinase
VSGFGLENLYRAIVAVDGAEAPERNAPEIIMAGLDGSCRVSRMALELFCAMLGTIAGNVALTFAARGGVYIAGGIAPRIKDFLARSEFRARFEC